MLRHVRGESFPWMAAPTHSVGFIVFVRLVKDSSSCLRYLEWNHPSTKVSELETLDSVN